ncbi:hypothetical protein LR48_Vigan06g101500 [Vigna angularis]|uniref:Uncharacterized protein n=1 Tax=Phaseolus angularis TaxID=3914 RepID=A0A0L9UT33_PHAAN|nr:hypothetical protein LR48_Vigan06g101500 [Vigna angularis]
MYYTWVADRPRRGSSTLTSNSMIVSKVNNSSKWIAFLERIEDQKRAEQARTTNPQTNSTETFWRPPWGRAASPRFHEEPDVRSVSTSLLRINTRKVQTYVQPWSSGDQLTSNLRRPMTSSLAILGGQVINSLVSSSDLLTSNPGRPCEDIQLWSSSDQLKPLLPRLNYKKLNPFAPANNCSGLGGLNVNNSSKWIAFSERIEDQKRTEQGRMTDPQTNSTETRNLLLL